jgi:hypothetical protein
MIPVVPQRKRCFRCKTLHASFAAALAHAKHVRRRDRERGCDESKRRVVIYFCTTHQNFHVGHERVGVPPGKCERGPDGRPNSTVEAPKVPDWRTEP